MANSPLSQQGEVLDLTILVDGKEIDSNYAVISVQVKRAINKISKAKIVLLESQSFDDDFDANKSDSFVPGKEVEIKAGYDGKSTAIYKGVITRHRARSQSGKGVELQLTCSDKAIKMTLGRQNRYFKELKDSDIIKKVIGDSGLSAKVGATTYQHPNLVQYYASDWDFVRMRAEVNGMIVANRDGELVVDKPAIAGSPVLKLSYGVDVFSYGMELNSEAQMVDVKGVAWDGKTQSMIEEASSEPTVNKQGNITGKKLAEVLNVSGLQLQSSAPIPKEMLKVWANSELLKARLSSTHGRLSCPGSALVFPNTLIELQGFGDRFDGEAYVSKVRHELANGDWITHIDYGLSSEWFIKKKANITAPPASGAIPAIEGLQIGIVKKIEKDPDQTNRVQVDIPVIDPKGGSVWARLANFYATNNAGSYFMPEVGDEVVLGFLNNDPRFPIILGMVHSAKNPSPETPDEKNNIKGFITKNQLKLTFDEERKAIMIETPGGNKVTLSDKDSSIALQDSNKNTITMDKSGVSIDSVKDINLKAKGNIKFSADAKITVDAKADVDVSGLNIKNSAKVAFKAEGQAQAELSAAGQTTVKGAMVMIN
ncbi:MAG: type VI secretion system tip protein VgrG [Bacteroidia bacterium]